MIFNSPVFLFAFLPITLLLSVLAGPRFRNTVLLLASLIFYAWGGVSYSIIILGSIVINYVIGRLIDRANNRSKKKRALVIGLIVNIVILITFKYAQFIVDSLFDLMALIHLSSSSPPNLKITLPIGISFFTFQAISYLVDVYRAEVLVQKNVFRLGLYISLFPQLIAGPIVRYNQLADQLVSRSQNWTKFAIGVKRFVLGLARKVLIANSLGLIADRIFDIPSGELSPLMAWVGVIAYAMQIYHDFAGYSDMAIGLGHMLGFDFPENFNFPYIARSIREFWRRWHITLSTWFRDYLYIPLGGSRISSSRTFINLIAVFFLTGLWHGASWNFVIWGLFHGFFMISERLFERIRLPKMHLLTLIYTWVVVLNSWVFFRAETFSQALAYLKSMWGFRGTELMWYSSMVNGFEGSILILAIIFSTPLPVIILNNYIRPFTLKNPWAYGFQSIAMAFVLFLCMMYIAAGTYNPFIYFRF